MDEGPNPAQMQELLRQQQEQRERRAAETAPTTKTEMGRRGFAAGGGVTRADGCVTKGHTKGRMI